MKENEKIGLFDEWYAENYDEWAEGEEGIALREELEQAFKGGIAELEKKNLDLIQEKYNLEYRIENLENKIEHHQEVIDTFKKENAELKQENKVLTQNLEDTEIVNKALEKENVELKEELRKKSEIISCDSSCYDNLLEIKDNLTKAKEIIHKICYEFGIYDKDLMEEAKQFLKGESTTELPNECHNCAKFDEMPNGPRCKTCDNGSHFQKKEVDQ